jgi:hypothetical protein
MFSYPHMCRDEHVEIGHSDSEHEMCPLCRALGALVNAEERLAALSWTPISEDNMPRVEEDEVGALEDEGNWQCMSAIYDADNEALGITLEASYWIKECGWTHFRPINAPHPLAAPAPEGESTR